MSSNNRFQFVSFENSQTINRIQSQIGTSFEDVNTKNIFASSAHFSSNLTVEGKLNATSILQDGDMRDKKDFSNFDTVPLLKDLKPTKFIWNSRDGKKVEKLDFGITSQNIDEVQTKHDAEWLELVNKENPEKFSTNWPKFIPLLIQGWQEQQSIIEYQNQIIVSQQADLKRIKEKLKL